MASSAAASRHENAASHPLVREVLARFPGAQIVDVRDKATEEPAAAVAPLPPDAEGDGADSLDDDDA